MTGKTSKKMNIMIVCLCFLASFSGYLHYIRNDIQNTYSSFKPLAEAIDNSIPKDEPVYSIDFCGDVVSAYLSDKVIISTPLDSIKNESFYVISSRTEIDGFALSYIYDGTDCFWDKYSLLKLTRLDNGQ